MKQQPRELKDLISIGPAMLRDFEILGIRSVAQLATQDPRKLYEKLGRLARQHQDICVLDTFAAAVAQARNPHLPAATCQWWWWSTQRNPQNPKAPPQGADRALRPPIWCCSVCWRKSRCTAT